MEITSKQDGIFTRKRFEHSSNACIPRSVILSGISTYVKAWQFLNISVSSTFNEVERVIDVNSMQLSNELFPRNETVSGIVIGHEIYPEILP